MGLKPELEARSNRVNGLKVSILSAPEVHGLFSAQSKSVRAQTAKPVVLSLSSSPCKRKNPTTVKQTDVNGWRVLGMFQLQLGNSPCREGAGLSLSVSFQQRGTSLFTMLILCCWSRDQHGRQQSQSDMLNMKWSDVWKNSSPSSKQSPPELEDNLPSLSLCSDYENAARSDLI